MELDHLDGEKIFVIRQFLARERCEQLIALSEGIGYGDAPITTSFGFVMRKDIRNNTRVMCDDLALAREFWELAQPHLPATWSYWQLAGINERFRFYRYDLGQRFAPHYDGSFECDNGERSHLTFMVYLNDGFEGGETAFLDSRPSLRILPECGMALVFYHKQLHEGAPVLRGRKYVVRTDVMYKRASRTTWA